VRGSLMRVSAVAVLGLGCIAASGRAQEAPAAKKQKLRVAIEKGKELLFRQTVSVRGGVAFGEGEPLVSNFDLIQEFVVSGEPIDEGAGGWRVAVHCVRVRSTCELLTGKGAWDSKDGAFTDEDFGKEDFKLVNINAWLMGVLAGKKPAVLLNGTGAVASLSGMGPVRAAAREAEPSGTFSVSLLEGVAWTPVYLFAQLPADPVAQGDTFKFPMQWTTARPGVNLRHVAEAKIDGIGDGKATFSWSGVPTAWKRGVRGKVAKAKEGTLTAGKCSGSATVSVTDGLPLAIDWKVSGTYHSVVLDTEAFDAFELTMKIERVEKLDPK
jgi:hypothetical protein